MPLAYIVLLLQKECPAFHYSYLRLIEPWIVSHTRNYNVSIYRTTILTVPLLGSRMVNDWFYKKVWVGDFILILLYIRYKFVAKQCYLLMKNVLLKSLFLDFTLSSKFYIKIFQFLVFLYIPIRLRSKF